MITQLLVFLALSSITSGVRLKPLGDAPFVVRIARLEARGSRSSRMTKGNRMKLLKFGVLSWFLVLGMLAACGSSDTSGGGGSSGGNGGGGSSGSSTAGGWRCEQMQSACSCSLYKTAPPSDTCKSKPSCCILYSVSDIDIDTCICNTLTAGETCARLYRDIRNGTIVPTCPP